MTNQIEAIAAAANHRPHSFAHIRSSTGLTLTDEQFKAMVEKNRGRFQLVRFIKRDEEGKRILPGRPGLKLRAKSV